jgi:hypothetical protein
VSQLVIAEAKDYPQTNVYAINPSFAFNGRASYDAHVAQFITFCPKPEARLAQ